MTETNIATAQNEYYKRPADERFATLDAMIAQAQYDKDHSRERTYALRDLRAIALAPTSDGQPREMDAAHRMTSETGGQLRLQSPNGTAKFTHWSFGQLARTISAPAAYLRTLPPAIAADAINYGLHHATDHGQQANLLVRANGGEPIIRAATSDTYGRVWDANLYGELNRYFGDGKQGNGGTWMTPPAWPGSLPSGQYRGDRDSFVIRVDGGSIVSDPSLSGLAGRTPNTGQGTGQGDGLYRGIMVRNSEVGHCSITIECVLFRYICGNHMLWGAIMDRKYSRRHVGTKITRDTMRELADLAWKFNQRTASQDEQIIRSLIQHEIAISKEAVISELQKMGATKAQASEAYATCEQTESASPRSFWGIAQGLTRISQANGWQDDRLQLDQLAAQVLKRGALIAA